MSGEEPASGKESSGSEPTGGEEPTRCPRCNEPFPTERLRDLHRGLEHDDLSEGERAAFESAYESERAEIRRFRLKVIGALVVLYFGLLFAYVLLA